MKKTNYPAFAEFLNEYQDAFTLKRFRELQIRNLLFYQAELTHLGQELEEIERRDTGSERFSTMWTPEMATGAPARAPSLLSKYSEKVIQIRQTLSSYNNAVEQFKRLEQLPTPHADDVKAAYNWLKHREGGGSFLAGGVEDVWTKTADESSTTAEKPDDFYSFTEQDELSFSISRIAALFWRLILRGRHKGKAYQINTTTSGRLAHTLLTVVASVLPVLPIVVFYFETRLSVRIGLIAMFTAVFAAILVVPLKMKPGEALAITTAIEAIQVVYVGGTSNSTSS